VQLVDWWWQPVLLTAQESSFLRSPSPPPFTHAHTYSALASTWCSTCMLLVTLNAADSNCMGKDRTTSPKHHPALNHPKGNVLCSKTCHGLHPHTHSSFSKLTLLQNSTISHKLQAAQVHQVGCSLRQNHDATWPPPPTHPHPTPITF
jgi:hypothetical protein